MCQYAINCETKAEKTLLSLIHTTISKFLYSLKKDTKFRCYLAIMIRKSKKLPQVKRGSSVVQYRYRLSIPKEFAYARQESILVLLCEGLYVLIL